MNSKSNSGSIEQINQIHNKAQAINGKLYYGKDKDGKIHTYRGNHLGRLKEETKLIGAEDNIINTDDKLNELIKNITDHHNGFKLIEETEEITININKQMTNWGELLIEGILNINGDLILEI